MQERFAKKLRWIYGICLSVFTVFLGALFIARVWAVYKCGVTPAFTRARVQAYFEILILPFWLWVLAVIGGEIVFTLFPKEKNLVKGYADVAATLNRLKGKLPQNDGGRYELNKKSNLRFIVGCICTALCVGISVICIVLLTEKSFLGYFENELIGASHSEAEKILLSLPLVCAAFALCIGVAYYFHSSRKQELSFVKKTLAENAKKGVKSEEKPQEKPISILGKIKAKTAIFRTEKFLLGARICLAVIGVMLVVVGICNGGMNAVLIKAVNLCKQCVGIG